jgi:hypothetical protein
MQPLSTWWVLRPLNSTVGGEARVLFLKDHRAPSRLVVDDADMAGRVLAWGGAAVAVLALVGLGAYFGVVGLDEADKLASVIGAFVALVGLALSGYGLVQERRGAPTPSPSPTAQQAPLANTQTNVAHGSATQFVVWDGDMVFHDSPASSRPAGGDGDVAAPASGDPDEA